MRSAYKPVWFVLFAVVAMVAIVGISRAYKPLPPSDGTGHIAWGNDLDAARRQSYDNGKPVLVYFTASWCGPCQQMKKSTWVDSKVAKAVTDGYIPVMIDVDAQREVASQFGVNGIPRMDVLTKSGERRTLAVGLVSVDEMLQLLR